MNSPPMQPWLHDLEVSVRGNVTCLSGPAGDIAEGATGLFVDDRRTLSRLTLTVGGFGPVPVAQAATGPRTEVLALARHLGDPGADPTVEVSRSRELVDDGFTERIEIVSKAASPVVTDLVLELAADGADLAAVKGGRRPRTTLAIATDGGGLRWSDRRHATSVTFDPKPREVDLDDGGARVSFDVEIAPGERFVVVVAVASTREVSTDFDATPGAHNVDWSAVRVAATDGRLDRLTATSLADLSGLLLADPLAPSDSFAAAGSPWYLTLFGRDSLWAARLALPFGTELARGTLAALARRQGRVHDPETAEEPGKVIHEVRRSTGQPSEAAHRLPPLYYGTVDATPLWVVALHEAWLWGLADETVRGLRPQLDQAMDWVRGSAAAGDGLISYQDVSGHGLSNQGWKDSDDAMRRRDGSIAPAPIALVETQAYAIDAALGMADLQERLFGEDGAPWRRFAKELAARVRERFWVADDLGPYLAMAIDGLGQPVDAVGSNMGHVLASGALTKDEEALVASRLARPDMLLRFGLATMSSATPGHNPIGYHTGSVWTHDSAVAALGLSRSGHSDVARQIIDRLVEVAPQFDYRWPELFGGLDVLGRAVPYPASCRPQAWSAASIGAVVSVLLGVRADAPAGRLVLEPLRPAPFGAMSLDGLRFGGEPWGVDLAADGSVVDVRAPAGVEIVVLGAE